jgi:flagellar biosynthesis protein FlhG
LASYDFDQAEGLRRMLSGPKPRVFTFLSATSDDEKSAMLSNLGASLADTGNRVTLVDARTGARGVSSHYDLPHSGTLLDVAKQQRALSDVVHTLPQGYDLAILTRASRRDVEALAKSQQARSLNNAFNLLARHTDIVLVDGEMDANDALPIPALSNGEIVVQVASRAESIKEAYSLIKRLNAQLGRRPFGIVVTGATDQEAQLVYDNIAKASNRYLAVQLCSLGSVPEDEHVRRAARLGRSVVDAFPLAGASVAFRRLAGRVAAPEAYAGMMRMNAVGAN